MIGRRASLIGAAALLAAAGPTSDVTSDIWAARAKRWIAPIRAAAARLHGPGLLRSYVVRQGAGASAFDRVQANAAFTYDNALAGLALLACGEQQLAFGIGEALRMAQAGDRKASSGRVRNAYQPGRMTEPPRLAGWWDVKARRWLEDPYQTGTSSGVLAWAMLLWQALDRVAGGQHFAEALDRAAKWLAGQRVARGFAGGVLGDGQGRLGFVSTEQNLDIGVVLTVLGENSGAEHALSFVRSMWDGRERRFDAGLTPNGQTNFLAAADANLWPQLAAGMPEPLRPALGFVLQRLGQRQGRLAGIGFSAGLRGIWLEGTAFATLALRLAGGKEEIAVAERFAATLEAETADDGLLYACSTPELATGLATAGSGSEPFVYYRRPALAPTAWAVLASREATPFGSPLPQASVSPG
ncbi:MAG: hypothetical protein ACREFP_04390 [Acetobacteraceae bacterium]